MTDFGSHTHDEFNAALQAFKAGCEAIYAKHIDCSPVTAFGLDWGRKNVRVTRGGSVHCFVDMRTGNVLMAAGYKKPAKHARGNIYDAQNGCGSMGPYGPAYLR